MTRRPTAARPPADRLRAWSPAADADAATPSPRWILLLAVLLALLAAARALLAA